MKTFTKFIAPLLLTTMSTTVLADNQSKIVVAQNSTFSGNIIDHSTTELFDLLDRVNEIKTYFGNQEGVCGFAEKYYVGHGNGDGYIMNWKATVVNGNVVRATFNMGGEPYHKDSSHLVEFVMQGDKIADVRHAENNNPNIFPTRATDSLKKVAQLIVKTKGERGC